MYKYFSFRIWTWKSFTEVKTTPFECFKFIENSLSLSSTIGLHFSPPVIFPCWPRRTLLAVLYSHCAWRKHSTCWMPCCYSATACSYSIAGNHTCLPLHLYSALYTVLFSTLWTSRDEKILQNKQLPSSLLWQTH